MPLPKPVKGKNGFSLIGGVDHVTFAVRNLERSFEFYVAILGCQPVAKWRSGAYLLAGKLWLCLTLDSKTRRKPLSEYTHLAFDVTQNNFSSLVRRLRKAKVKTWQRNKSEGASYYFLDPDGHKLEIHVGSLESRLVAMREDPWEVIEYF